MEDLLPIDFVPVNLLWCCQECDSLLVHIFVGDDNPQAEDWDGMDDDWDVFTPTPPVPIGDSEAIVQSTPAQCSGSPDSPDNVIERRGTHKAYIPSPFTPMPKYEAMGDEQLKVGVAPLSFRVYVVMLGGKIDFFIL